MKVFVAIVEPGNLDNVISAECNTQEELNTAIEKLKSYLDDIANDFDETDPEVCCVIVNYQFAKPEGDK